MLASAVPGWKETMAVTMIIGTPTNFSWSLFGTGPTRSQAMLAKPIWRNPAAFQVSALLYAPLIVFCACSPSR